MPDTSDEPIYTLLKQRHAPDYPEQDLRLLAYELKQLQNQAIRAEMLSIVPKNYAAKEGLNVAQLWDSADATDGYNQALSDIRQQVISRYGAEDGGDV